MKRAGSLPRVRNGQRWWVFVAICGLLIALASLGDSGRELLRYDRRAVEQGQLWRIVTAHGVHLGWRHLAVNVAGLGVLWWLFIRCYGAGHWLWVLAAAMASIAIGFYFLEPQLQWYVGASGLLHGVMAAGIIAYWRPGWRCRLPGALPLALFLLGKLLLEQWIGPLSSSAAAAGANVIVDAHLYGAIGGGLAAVWLPQPGHSCNTV